MNTIEQFNEHVMQTYGRIGLVMESGHGQTTVGEDGKEYIDFGSGIGTNSLGYCDEDWVNAICEQAHKIQHTSNYYYTKVQADFAKRLCEATGYEKMFFGNSGAEANECAIKLARKYSFDKYGKGRSTIITLNHSFHGRTMATITATGQPHYHTYFFPFVEDFRYADPTLESIQAQGGDDVCAVMVELIQGEGGVRPLDKAMVQALAKLCQEKDWLLLVDEVQTGIGRTGTLFAYQQFDIQPDVVSFAKGIAGGLPLGGILASEKCATVLTPGTHGSTFGANPVSTAAGGAVMAKLDDAFLKEVQEKGQYLRTSIENLGSPWLGGVVGMGLMLGVDVKEGHTNKELATLLLDNGLLCLTAGERLRLLPPLVITKDEMDKGLAIMKQTLHD